ncbi:amino acid adenylation domain-containing protein [Pseudomonas graminis]|uniref:amino acid adenylation domain-containing protein n=1 Tax=Pseudomonas graminis TaxID=158627 RepID=UPI00234BE13D|nr:amino acid adenylation domain-containing protein [Pseudomonas graminis]MDC6382025.1 amino acid adenylation domain-containing protein [Pseudomonas graminis]
MSLPLQTVSGPSVFSVDISLVDHLEKIFSERGVAIAIFDADVALSYASMRDELLKLHSYFYSIGLRPGSVVAVHLDLQLRYPLIVLGILLSGLVYLPVAPNLPDYQKRLILQAAQPDLLITETSLPEVSTRLATVRELFRTGKISEKFDVFLESSPSDLAYIIFTSGTTGFPKGVKIPRGSFFNRLQWARDYYSLGPEDITALKTPFSFDPSIQEAILPFFSGGATFVPDPRFVNFPNYLSECIGQFGISMLIMVPSQLKYLMSSPSLKACERLRHIVCCGEPWGAELIAALNKCLPECQIYNGYGPTEATIGTLVFKPEKGYSESYVPIGKPIAGTHVAVVGKDLRSVPAGEIGELIIGGTSVGSGYLGNVALTAQRFKNLEVEGLGMLPFYLSGDRARILPSGNIQFLGRMDNQVKINGVRVELEEVEFALRASPTVMDAVVIKLSSETGDYLHAFVLSSTPLDIKCLSETCSEHLNRAVIPSRFTQVSRFPLTHNGKVDRRGLAERAALGGIPE